MIIFPAPRRCSGYSRGEECKFSLLLDVGESEVWGGGLVTISHICVNTGDIVTECGNTDTQVTGSDSYWDSDILCLCCDDTSRQKRNCFDEQDILRLIESLSNYNNT